MMVHGVFTRRWMLVLVALNLANKHIMRNVSRYLTGYCTYSTFCLDAIV